MINNHLSDEERVELAKMEYNSLQIGDEIIIDDHFVGSVTRNVYAKDGMQAYLIENYNGRQKEITVLFKGSYGFKKGNPTTWKDEWLNTNLPILRAMLTRKRRIPAQLKSAAYYLNRWVSEFPNARFYIYGHSLGAINAQFAIVNCHHPELISGAYLYEGTNIWRLLNHKERLIANEYRQRINAYVDIYDPVTLGITATHKMVGKLHYVDSEPMSPIKQHMWGGYRFDSRGRLLEKKIDADFLQFSSAQNRLLNQTSRWSYMMSEAYSFSFADLKKMTSDKFSKLKYEILTDNFFKQFSEDEKDEK